MKNGPASPSASSASTDEVVGSGLLADPSQQIARMDGAGLRRLVDGARYLFTNAYERALLIRKTGWNSRQLLRRVGARVTTTGPEGVIVSSACRLARSCERPRGMHPTSPDVNASGQAIDP